MLIEARNPRQTQNRSRLVEIRRRPSGTRLLTPFQSTLPSAYPLVKTASRRAPKSCFAMAAWPTARCSKGTASALQTTSTTTCSLSWDLKYRTLTSNTACSSSRNSSRSRQLVKRAVFRSARATSRFTTIISTWKCWSSWKFFPSMLKRTISAALLRHVRSHSSTLPSKNYRRFIKTSWINSPPLCRKIWLIWEIPKRWRSLQFASTLPTFTALNRSVFSSTRSVWPRSCSTWSRG